jgi:pantothenate kinase type III
MGRRIVNTVAAYERVGGACVVADFGTSTNFDVVSAPDRLKLIWERNRS